VFAVLVPALALTACKKKPTEEGNNEPAIVVQDVSTPLSVVAIDPSRGDEQTSLSAVVRGAAFEMGARVYVGPVQVNDVEYLSENAMRIMVPPLDVGRYDIEVVNPDDTSSVLRQGLTIDTPSVACDNSTVYFQVDSSSLTDDSESLLATNLQCYQTMSSTIRIEGHCDERGTTDYNLALGQRRAESVARSLASSGVASSRLQRVSYGEERPAVSGHDEDAWGQNRRAEIVLTK
jgi:peptidoglycan-associated lipoprotein